MKQPQVCTFLEKFLEGGKLVADVKIHPEVIALYMCSLRTHLDFLTAVSAQDELVIMASFTDWAAISI
jgi:hypothetical protein